MAQDPRAWYEELAAEEYRLLQAPPSSTGSIIGSTWRNHPPNWFQLAKAQRRERKHCYS